MPQPPRLDPAGVDTPLPPPPDEEGPSAVATASASALPPNPARISTRLTPLDGLRGVAISLVVLYHYFGTFAATPLGLHQEFSPLNLFVIAFTRFVGLSSLGWTGVDLFFVLSGFLVGGIIFEKGESPNFRRAFWVRRFWRLAPVYGIFLLAYIGQKLLLGDTALFKSIFGDSFPLWVYFTGTHNLAVAYYGAWKNQSQAMLWSLALEVQFYVLAPLILSFGSRQARAWRLVGLIALALLSRYLSWHFAAPTSNPSLTTYVLFPDRMDTLWLGVLVAWGLREPVWTARLDQYRTSLKALAYGGGAWWLIVAWNSRQGDNSQTMAIWGYSLLALWYSLLLVLVATSTSPQRLLNSRALQFLGLRAYAIYLFHQMLNAELHAVLLHRSPMVRDGLDLGVSLLSCVLCLLLAEVLWRTVEYPSLLRGHATKY